MSARNSLQRPATIDLASKFVAPKRFQRVQLRDATRAVFFHGQPYVSLLKKKEAGTRITTAHESGLGNTAQESANLPVGPIKSRNERARPIQ